MLRQLFYFPSLLAILNMYTKPKSVIVVEDQTAIRQMIVAIVKNNPAFDVIGDFGDGHEAFVQCLDLAPDLVVLDVMLPSLNGIEILKRLIKKLPKMRVLVFSGHQNANMVYEIIQAGAHGFVEKSANLEELRKGLEIVSSGGTYFGPQVSELLRMTVFRPQATQTGGMMALSKREKEVLQLIAESHSTKTIADKLGISQKTAENHRASLMKKLDLHGVAGLTRYAIQNGIIESGLTTQLN